MSRSRLPIVIVILISLGLSMGSRYWAMAYRGRAASADAVGSNASIGYFDSYALALLLGGLRGPLVMVLWTSSEQQKSDRNLEDFDTKIEWIRLLQPEFDSVHIFQMWNKAYNISVQMASLSNKYTTILEAIDYGNEVDRERPNDINILETLGQTWAEKLGGSNEKAFYRDRVRRESMAHVSRQKLARSDPAWRRVELDPILDAAGNILPQYLAPRSPPIGSLVRVDGQSLDGSDLQFLRPFQPFPEGVSPVAIGYNYYKRAAILQAVGNQKHLQLSESVVDSRAAVAAKTWAEEEWERGRRFELAAFGLTPPGTERLDLENAAANIKFGQTPLDLPAARRAIASYARAVQVTNAALAEFKDHISRFPQDVAQQSAQEDHLRGMVALNQADRDFLAAGLANGDERAALAHAASKEYQEASDLMALNGLRYFIDPATIQRLFNRSRADLRYDPSRPYELTNILLKTDEAVSKVKNYDDQNREDRDEYLTYMRRATSRQLALKAAGYAQ
jgi:hypothetical protein